MSIDSLKRRVDRLDEGRGSAVVELLPETVKLDVASMSREERDRLKALLLAAKAKAEVEGVSVIKLDDFNGPDSDWLRQTLTARSIGPLKEGDVQ